VTAPARRAVVAVAWLAVAQVVVALAAAVSNTQGTVPTVLRGGLAVVTAGVWLAVVVLAVLLVRAPAVRARLLSGALRWARALYVQRLSLVVVLVLGVLALNPGPDVADQLPDVVRRWLDLSSDATRHLLLALLATGLTAAGLFVVGRLRTERAWTEAVGGLPRPDAPASRLWLAWPVLALVAAAALAVTRTQTSFDWRFWLAVAVPVVVFVASRVVRALVALPAPVPASSLGEGWARTVWRAGDALAAAVVVLLGLALLRAFTAPAVLGPPSTTDPLAGSRQGWEVTAVVAGVALTAGAPLLLRLLVRRVDVELEARAAAAAGAVFRWSPLWPPAPAVGALTASARAVAAAAVVALAGLALWPVGASSLLGVFAVAELALLAWAVVVGLVLVHLQHHQPAEVFRLLRMRYNPVMTLALAVPLVASLSGGDPTVHALRPTGGMPPALQTQTALTALTRQWLTTGAGCVITLADGGDGEPVQVQPLVLLAADGGGIRASRWTVEAVRRFTDAWRAGAPGCARSPLLLASGVSGGSVGLALSGGDGDARAGQRALEEPGALGAAAVGLLVRDMLAGGAGLKIPAVDAGGAWTDRAGLMESVWERRSDALRRPFSVAADPGRPALVFNAAAAGLGCRVLVAQADVRAAPPLAATLGVAAAAPAGEQRVADCRGRTDLPAGTIDLWQSYGSCLPAVSRATAAMLSARFAVVTPAARVRGCGGLPDLQLVDGGYGEGSGLGTLDEVLPTVLDAVRGANATGRGVRTVVVPVVVFLQNRPGADVSAPPPGLSAELLVPLSGGVAKDVQSNTGAWLQRASTQLLGACPRGDVPCQTVLARFWRTLPGGVVVVAPSAQPAVEPPLGWTLSAASRIRLVTAMDRETATCRDPRTTGILGNYGRFGALLSWLGDHRECAGDTR
jgi:hypothetical protein